MKHEYGKHNSVPPAKYTEEGIRWSDIVEHHTPSEVEQLEEWLTGQTIPVIDGVGGVFTWDYERWLAGIPNEGEHFD